MTEPVRCPLCDELRYDLDNTEIARDQWRANALRLSKLLEEAQREVARLSAEAERLRP